MASAEDPLASALHHLRMDGVFYCASTLTRPWGSWMPPFEDHLWFHVVTTGEALLIEADDTVHRLAPGDVAVVPRGVGHRIIDDADNTEAPSVLDLPHQYVSANYASLSHGGGGARTDLVCGVVRFGHPAARSLLAQLPDVLVMEGEVDSPEWRWLPSLLELMAAETRSMRPGGEAVVTRLCDILVIQAIRNWIGSDPGAATGWIGALRDPQVGHTIAMMHRSPERAWTVADLASEAAMSRSAYAARFTELVGMAPRRYLAEWRMQVAFDILTNEQATVLEVASRLGYGSEAAFSRAFKRMTGRNPSTVRLAAAGRDRGTGSDDRADPPVGFNVFPAR